MSQISPTWTPTPKQAAVLEAAQEAGLNRSIAAICAAAGVDRRGFYRWLEKDPHFKAAWEDIWRSAIRRHLPGVVAAMIAKAQDGDVPAARLIADLAGVMRQRVEASVQAEVHQQTEVSVNPGEALEPFVDPIGELVERWVATRGASDADAAGGNGA